MKRRTLLRSVFIILILLTVVTAIGLSIYDHHANYDFDTDKYVDWPFDWTLYLLLVSPVLFFELELYRCTRYFFLCTHKHILWTVLNTLSLLLLPGLVITAWLISQNTYTPSIMLLESPFFVAPIHFLIIRLLGMHRFVTEEAADA